MNLSQTLQTPPLATKTAVTIKLEGAQTTEPNFTKEMHYRLTTTFLADTPSLWISIAF